MRRKPGLVLSALVTLALTGACTVSGGVIDDDATLTIVNESSYVITEIRLAEVGSRSWGHNLLDDVLFPGEELVIVGIPCGRYDALVTDETGLDCALANISLCFEDDVWVIDDFTLNVCAFGAQ
jgi:hypothetical protein